MKMFLLPSEQKERVEKAICTFNEIGSLSIYEPCDCGARIMHSNGGNYHKRIHLKRDTGQVFVKYGTTCELVPPSQWEKCDNFEKVIREYADFL